MLVAGKAGQSILSVDKLVHMLEGWRSEPGLKPPFLRSSKVAEELIQRWTNANAANADNQVSQAAIDVDVVRPTLLFSRKSEKEESRKWTMCLVDSINTQNYYCRSFLLPGNISEMQQLLLRENVQSVKERQPMMQTNKILYGVSKRSSSRKPDSPAKTTRKACDQAKW